MVGPVGQEEPGGGERLDQVEELAGSRHGEGLYVGRDVGQDGQQTLEQGLQPLMARGDNLQQEKHSYCDDANKVCQLTLWNTMISRSAWVPLNTEMSMGTAAV